MSRPLSLPLSQQTVNTLVSGDQVELSGTFYTARDAAHKRLVECIQSGIPLPLDLHGQVLYYTGPTPARNGMPIGSAGPTTSSRMDRYTPELIAHTGLTGIIGKGSRSRAVIDAFVKFKCVYFAATGGAGALLGNCIKKARVVCYEDLGPEAIYELEVTNFPVTVAIDVQGKNCYEEGPAVWRK